jgi:hypothetical protein
MDDVVVPKANLPESQQQEPQQQESQEPAVDESQTAGAISPIHMKSVDRVSKLPVVEETLKIVINFYGKVRVSSFP